MQIDQPFHRLDLLQNLLSEQLGVYHQLLDLTKQERSALTKSNLELMNDVISEKAGLVQVINSLENRRIKLMADLAASFKFNLKNLTLVNLADLTDPDTSEKLLQLRRDLSSVVKKLQKENHLNQHLMTHCVKLMDNSINLLSSLSHQEPTYIHTGHFNRIEEGGVLFSSKI